MTILAGTSTDEVWQSPIDLTNYDRTATFTDTERSALDQVIQRFEAGKNLLTRFFPAPLNRLTQPLFDVLDWAGANRQIRRETVDLLLWEMHRRQTSFWGWATDDWIAVVRAEGTPLLYHRLIDYRQYVFAIGYFLGNFSDFSALGTFYRPTLASKIFGPEPVAAAITCVQTELRRWGYSVSKTQRFLPRVVCEILLLNRSPRLADLTSERLASFRQQSLPYLDTIYVQVSRALVSRGIITTPLASSHSITTTATLPDTLSDVSDEWVRWCQRWRDTTTIAPATRKRLYYYLLKTGRWLAATHPHITSPADWTRELAAEYVAAVDQMTVGVWTHGPIPKELVGQPLQPSGKRHHLMALRMFIRDCQDWGWIPRTLDLQRSLATPQAIQALIGPAPRVIADDIWAKLLWAGLTLTADDLPVHTRPQDCKRRELWYPLELVRALVITWLFSGLRLNEIRRLPIGCIRWQHHETQLDQSAGSIPKEAICLLDVPVNKTSTAFTKPVDRVVGEAIMEWERVRPEQPVGTDPKTGALVHFLFSYRGKQIGESYLNACLIPLLCQKAGVPTSDARGPITTHRARSTIATQLYNAKEPLSLFELQEWLGHRSPTTTQHYARITPTRLAKSYQAAGYFDRNLRTIAVLIDQDVVTSGRAAIGTPWKYYDLGHGYCSYDFFDQCPHRMACAKCAFYLPKESSQAQILEAKANLQHLLQAFPLTDEERAAVEDGLQAMEQLSTKLTDIPTPAGPTPRQLVGQHIPEKSIGISRSRGPKSTWEERRGEGGEGGVGEGVGA